MLTRVVLGLLSIHERSGDGKALATMPAREKREVAEWLLGQIEDQIPRDFFVGLQKVREERRLNEEGRV